MYFNAYFQGKERRGKVIKGGFFEEENEGRGVPKLKSRLFLSPMRYLLYTADLPPRLFSHVGLHLFSEKSLSRGRWPAIDGGLIVLTSIL